MKELILIHGTNLEKAKKALKEAAKCMNNDDLSITTLRLYTTRDDNTFAVRPNRLCDPWHFSILCDNLLSALENDKDAYIEAWFVLTVEYTMDEVPKYKKLYLSFDKEKCTTDIIDPKGNLYKMFEYEIEEDVEGIQIEMVGTGDYKPYPKMQFTPLPDGEGLFHVGSQSRKRKLSTIYQWSRLSEVIPSIIVLIIGAITIFSMIAIWDYSETLLPFSINFWVPFAVCVVIGFILAVEKIVLKIFNFWGRFILSTLAVAWVAGVLMVLVFSVNQWFESPEPIYGSGIVREMEARGGDDVNYNYKVDVFEPIEGNLDIRMYHDGSFSVNENVKVVLHRGLYGMYHAEKIEHREGDRLRWKSVF